MFQVDSSILLGLAIMEIGLGLGFRVFIVTFRAGFHELFFVSIALAVAEAFVNLVRSESTSHAADFDVEPDWSP